MSTETAPSAHSTSRFRTIIALLAAVFAFAAALSLGNWQLRRAAQKLAIEQSWAAAETDAAIDLTANAISKVPERLLNRPLRVRMRGQFVHDKTVWLDNRQMNGRAGFFVATPLQLEQQAGVVLVLRGWAPRNMADRTQLPAIGQPTATVTLEGLALADAPRLYQLGDAAVPDQLPAIWQNLDRAAYARVSGLHVAPFVVQQTSALDDTLERKWARPASGVDKHRGYAVQWYALAALIAVLTIVFGVRSWRKRNVPSPITSP